MSSSGFTPRAGLRRLVLEHNPEGGVQQRALSRAMRVRSFGGFRFWNLLPTLVRPSVASPGASQDAAAMRASLRLPLTS